MRICFVADGASVHTKRWVDIFSTLGHEVHLITDSPVSLKGARVHLLGERKGFASFLARAFRTRRLVKRIRPDVLHAHYVFGYGTFGAFAGFHPFVLSVWGNEVQPEIDANLRNSRFRLRLAKYLIRYSLDRADLVHTLEDYQKELCLRVGVPEDKIVVLHNYVDSALFSPDKRSEQLRSGLGLGGGPLIICLRGYHSDYDVDTYLRAVPHVVNSVPEARFLLAGEQGGKEDKERTLRLMEDLGIAGNLKLLGHVRSDDLPQLLASCDIHVDPISWGGGIGHGNMQVMSSGLARIAADREGVDVVVKDGKTGLLFRKGDPKDLADKILVLIKDEALRKEISTGARELVLEINRTGKNELGMMRYYEELTKKR